MSGPLALLALTSCLGLTLPALPQQRAEGWLEVAELIGGSGVAHGGCYVRLLPSRAWIRATPPAWLEFRRHGGESVLRGTVPVLRTRAPAAVAALRHALPEGAEVRARDTYGANSPRVHVRLFAAGAPVALAGSLRDALGEIEPGVLARIDTIGIIERDPFEGEERLVVRAVGGERIDVGVLPAELRREGAHLRLVAERKEGRPGRFLYCGAADAWRTLATLEHVEAQPAPGTPFRGNRREDMAWFAACRVHARALLDADELEVRRLDTPLASGFDRFSDPGFAVCPRCRHALAKDWLFTDSSYDGVDASLRCCAADGLYFLGRDGFDHGPFFPDLEPQKDRR